MQFLPFQSSPVCPDQIHQPCWCYCQGMQSPPLHRLLPPSSSILPALSAFLVLTLITFLLILWPVFAEIFASRVGLDCMSWCLCESRTMSSAKSRYSSRVVKAHCMPSRCFFVVFRISQSMTSKNKKGANRHPWCTPVSISNSSEKLRCELLCRYISHRSSVWGWCISLGCHDDVTASTTIPCQRCQRHSHNPQRSCKQESSTRETSHRWSSRRQCDLYTNFPSGTQLVHPTVVCPALLSVSPGLSFSALFRQSIPLQFLHFFRSPFFEILIR